MACPSRHDQAFGPRVNTYCRSFDFTLQFEDIFFLCIPAAGFLCIAPLSIVAALKRPCIRSSKSKLLACRLAILCGFFATQTTVLVLRLRHEALRTPTSLSADLVTLVATVVIFGLSSVTHQRSRRPSSLISLYLSAYAILGIARSRTLWLISPRSSAAASATASIVLAALALGLDFVKPSSTQMSHKQQQTPEQTSGLWNRVIFGWLVETFRLGSAKVISVDDLPKLDVKLESENLLPDLDSAWAQFTRRKRNSLLQACFRSYFLSFISAIIPRLCLTAFTFSQPFLLNTTVELIQQAQPDIDYGRALIGAWALVFVGIAICNSAFQYQSFRFVTRLRGGLTALVYQHAMQSREADKGPITAMALLGADIPQIVAGTQFLHEIWASPLDIAIGTWLLERQLSLACLAPAALVIVFIGITSRISAAANQRQRRWIERIQERLKATSQLLSEMKPIKMLGLTESASTTIRKLRHAEIQASTAYRKVLLTVLLLSNTPLNLAPTITFAVYVVISIYWKGSTLEVGQAFSALALISLLTSPTMLFTQILPRVIQALGCFDRIQEYCNYVDQGSNCLIRSTCSPADSSSVDITNETFELTGKSLDRSLDRSLNGVTFTWKKDAPPALKTITLIQEPGTVTAIIGPVGSGKSTLLASMLGETLASDPSHQRLSSAAISFCAQEPWLENKTIRDSIIGENAYNDKWYSSVKLACDLEHDIAAQTQGDWTCIGSRGASLSGGQRQRVALARALYARSSMFLLDDIFSGMDAHTVENVSERLIGSDGLLRRMKATVFLVSSNRKVIAQSDRVVTLHDGEIVSTVQTQNLVDNHGHLRNVDIGVSDVDISDQTVKTGPSIPSKAATSKPASKISNPDDQRRKQGGLSTYHYYFSRSGYIFLLGNLLSVSVWIFLTEFSTIWIKWWSEDNERHPNRKVGTYMGVYATFGVAGTLCSCLGGWFLLVRMISRSSESLHSDLLKATLSAPFWFFTSTDAGEILNRFSQDMELVDMALPALVSSFITSTTQCLIKLVILLVFSQYLGVAVPILGTVLYLLQRFYLRTSRQVRLLGIEAKAPLYAYIKDCVDGAVTIRAFGWQSRYLQNVYARIDQFQRPEYMQSCIQHWLTFVLDMIVAALAVILVATIVTWHDRFDAGSVGVALVMIIGFSTSLMRVIKSWTSMESSISAVTRIKRFVDETQDEDDVKGQLADPAWPQSGAVKIEALHASYSPTSSAVLKGISLTVESGQHVAICGRSGSGKTSLGLSILRMVHIRKGTIKIDDVDITSRSPEDVRKALNAVPQEPFLMPGTVRFNADPSGIATDEEIISALVRVNFWATISEQGGLDQDVHPLGWSVGQRQLFCLARAIVKKSMVLILDEAMSSVDNDTEALMQDIIDTDLKHVTILAVMHRLDHVMKYDRVAVLEDGGIVEFGDPRRLVNEESRFMELLRSSQR